MRSKVGLLLQIFLTVLLIVQSGELKGTQQFPDELKYNDLQLDLETGWGYPSPLEVYFIETDLEYPFTSQSSANYRGFIAKWEIKSDKLFLNKIKIKQKIFKPKCFKVKSNNVKFNRKGEVYADWFSGVIECSFRNEYDYNYITTFFIQIRNGQIIDTQKLEGHIGNGNYGSKLNEVELYKMHWDYMAFYFRAMDDNVTLNGESGRLNLSRYKSSPLLDFYGESVLDYKFNWENREKNGHPNSAWIIENNKVYLESLTLMYGNRIDTIYSHHVDLKSEFQDKYLESKVEAEWVNGIYLLKFGKIKREEVWENYEIDVLEVSKFVLIRIIK